MDKTLLTLCLLCGSTTLFSQNFNRPVPGAVAPYEFIAYDTGYKGYFLTAPFELQPGPADTGLRVAMILDKDGYLFWYLPSTARSLLDFKFHPEQQVYSYVEFNGPMQVQFKLMGPDFMPLDSFTTVDGIVPDVHDFQITTNHTYLLAGASDSLADLSAFQFNGMPGSPTTHLLGFVVQEFDEDHNLLFQWDSNDHIAFQAAYGFYGYNAAAYDYCHGNAIAEDKDGHLLLSFRHLNAVYRIDRYTGEVLWQLGGKNSSFTFVDDEGFSGQHDVRRLPNGNISLFDNSNMGPLPRKSRGVEYSLDTVNWTATKVWEYQYDPAFFSMAMGNNQTTADGLHLINYGINYRPKPSFVLVDDAGTLQSELFFRDSLASYRSFQFDLPVNSIERPAISCAQDSGLLTLTAPPGFTDYAWSTGENTASIIVQHSGTYQVWVNYGAGMLGSRPFVVQDLATACASSSAKEPQRVGPETVVGYYDLLGRLLARPNAKKSSTQPYLIRYADGKVRLSLH